MPVIDVCIQIWPNHPRRIEYFRQTVDAAMAKLTANGMELAFRVSSESERPADAGSRWCGDELIEECAKRGLPLHFRDGPANIADHLNEIFANPRGDLLFLLQDDYELNRPLDLSPAADLLLRATRNLLGVRYWANTQYENLTVCGFPLVKNAAAYSYGDNPALWHPRFFTTMGPFEDGGPRLIHEVKMSQRLAGMVAEDAMVAAMPDLEADPNYWFGHKGFISSSPNDRRWANQIGNRIADLENFPES
jgi:hypothetical protein